MMIDWLGRHQSSNENLQHDRSTMMETDTKNSKTIRIKMNIQLPIESLKDSRTTKASTISNTG